MGKKSSRVGKGSSVASATAAATTVIGEDGAVPVVGGRDACPCGSGRRYKA